FAALVGPEDGVDVLVTDFDLCGKVFVKGLIRLPGFRCRTPGGAFYVFPNIEETGLDARSLQKRLLEEAGVATVAGTSFGHLGEGFIRFSYANSVDNIENALERIASLLAE
ncbi:MAG: aminotransferase class I/II-fold pyridoxal phosphate-dependent enzyme, partial [Pseudomonadota bacterium]|nr:aminotransferase class I/II-fold pyridoxal phosphate-dependent enzyme [Pseudomonadota bacterium]